MGQLDKQMGHRAKNGTPRQKMGHPDKKGTHRQKKWDN